MNPRPKIGDVLTIGPMPETRTPTIRWTVTMTDQGGLTLQDSNGFDETLAWDDWDARYGVRVVDWKHAEPIPAPPEEPAEVEPIDEIPFGHSESQPAVEAEADPAAESTDAAGSESAVGPRGHVGEPGADLEIPDGGLEEARQLELQRTLLEVSNVSPSLAKRLAMLDPPVRTLGDFADLQAKARDAKQPWWLMVKYVGQAKRGRGIDKAVEQHWRRWHLAHESL